MANNIITLDSLKNEAVRIWDSTIAVFPQFSQEEHLHVSDYIPKFNGCYATNNSTVCFVSDDCVYVTPITRVVMRSLNAAGFNEDYFYVPFSNGDYPKSEQEKWNQLLMSAKISYERDFVDDCIDYCDKYHIGTINEDTLERCFVMPTRGIKVRHAHYETCYYPILNSNFLDSWAEQYLGRYCTNNGIVVFVYRNGKTYVTKGNSILNELIAAGYSRAGMFVPFSNGEKILDTALKEYWESIIK